MLQRLSPPKCSSKVRKPVVLNTPARVKHERLFNHCRGGMTPFLDLTGYFERTVNSTRGQPMFNKKDPASFLKKSLKNRAVDIICNGSAFSNWENYRTN